MKRLVVLAAALAVAGGAAAQSKKELVNKLVTLQQEAIVRSFVEQPAAQIWQQAVGVIQTKVPADKRDAMAKDVQAELKKFVDDTYPQVKDKGAKTVTAVLVPMYEQKFSEDELKQYIAWLESSAAKKVQQTGPEMQKAVMEKLMIELRSTIEPKANAMGEKIGAKLGVPPAAAASAPAKK
jgi:hypothetical protein